MHSQWTKEGLGFNKDWQNAALAPPFPHPSIQRKGRLGSPIVKQENRQERIKPIRQFCKAQSIVQSESAASQMQEAVN